jgi:formate hydrogenlyase subunit 3/multisubunit Na+/H+ antiporter MnhD subunit
MINALLYLIFAPIAFGFLMFLLKRLQPAVAILFALSNLAVAFYVLFSGEAKFFYLIREVNIALSLKSDALSSAMVLAAAFLTLFIIIYSAGFFKERPAGFYGNVLIVLGASSGVMLSGSLLMLCVFWGASALCLYNIVNAGGDRATAAAKKSFITVGGADAFLILGIALLFSLTGTFEIDAIKLSTEKALPIFAYLCLLIAALAKAGAMPFHRWIIDCAPSAPTPVMALLPAGLDKLLGIYLLCRLSLSMFTITLYSPLSLTLLVLGSCTIVFAVFAALFEHDLKKLLSFHAVSQVGYMILGIGTGSFMGIAGALFHLINNVIYKPCLFMGAGAVEKETGTTNLDSLGGLSKAMPITFFSMMIAALSIAGIPPLNGFSSKWMIYQALFAASSRGGVLWMVWLVCAMVGSALTLASFMKLINAVFFGARRGAFTETKASMWIPQVILALICVIFGVFAFGIPLKYLILPAVPGVIFVGIWPSTPAAILLVLGLLIGFLIFLIGSLRVVKVSPVFIGGEDISGSRMSMSGVHFFDSIKDVKIVKKLFEASKRGSFDIYAGISKAASRASEVLRGLHTGLLHTYLAWCLLGLVALLIAFFR